MTLCILCGSPTSPFFRARDYRRGDDPKERQVNWCDACKFGRLEGDFTPAEISTFYPAVYYTHGSEAESASKVSFFDRLRVHLAWRLDAGIPMQPGEVNRLHKGRPTFCDLGCGSGKQLSQFKEAGYEIIGVEPDPPARAIAQEVAEVLDGTAENIPQEINGRKFDVVLLSHVLEHCIDPIKALTNARQILNADGTLIVEVPNNNALGFSTFKALWPWTDVPRHLNFFTEQSLDLALQKAGLKLTNVNYVGYTRQFQLEWIRTQDDIWAQIGAKPKPNFGSSAWKLLFRTAFAPAAAKYDSVRIHAAPSHAITSSKSKRAESATGAL